ncbi:MurR/RpiR family transcriptional regulator [Pectinatus sottacetonis]|uniref:MurR/RpiR family transcriptional regulator n=1 Tax=Pectinatus sottacetonis TaxID=1002795 RepID=UPI0018C4CA5E|nr:MurR/RpiR family transcriptional regulator [Pectinatus sottacetonis]
MKLDNLVSSNLNKLNPTDLIVWQYICKNKKKCCHISIYDIAKECNVSRTTVLRFAKKISLDGFSDLKMMLKMELGKEGEDSSADIAKAAVNLCKRVGEEVAGQDFTSANKLMYNAKRIFVYSSGYVQENVANEMKRLFLSCNLLIYEIKGIDEFERMLKNIDKTDLFIIISLSGESAHVVEFARKLHMYGVPFISMTRLKSNTLASLSAEHLYITPIALPTAVDDNYESMLMFFLVVEIWYVTYSRYLMEQGIDDM